MISLSEEKIEIQILHSNVKFFFFFNKGDKLFFPSHVSCIYFFIFFCRAFLIGVFFLSCLDYFILFFFLEEIGKSLFIFFFRGLGGLCSIFVVSFFCIFFFILLKKDKITNTFCLYRHFFFWCVISFWF